MPALTVYLCRLIGLVALISGAAMLIDKQPHVAAIGALAGEPALLYVMGIVSLVAGVAIVLVHNVWTSGLPALLVTLVGWIFLVRGVVVMLLPPEVISEFIGELHVAEFYYLYAAIPLILGAYLSLRGFAAVAASSTTAGAATSETAGNKP